MAQDTPKVEKDPGRIKQMVQIYKRTKQTDRKLPFILLLTFLVPIILVVVFAVWMQVGVIGWILWPILGILLGVLITMIVLGRRAERTAYQQIEGMPGAVGAVINGALRRTWRGSEIPIAVTRQQDALYRVVGRGGVVVIAEGNAQRLKPLIAKEMTQLKRTLPNVKITQLYVGPDGDGVPVSKLSKTLIRLKPALTRPEVVAVYNRLSSLQSAPIGIPKGMDPNRVRPGRPR